MNAVSGWRLRDTFSAVALFITTAAFTLWQNTRVAVLWDISYLLDSSYRIRLGQSPYKDFPFAHPPLTFLLHAAITRVFGRVYFPHICFAALEAGAATLLSWRILLSLLQPFARSSWPLAALLATPLTVLGIYAIYPHPIYDSDCILAVLVAIYLLQRCGDNLTRNTLAGAACVLPLFFKQNIGLPFLAVTLLAVLILAVLRRIGRSSITPQLALFAGALAAFASILVAIHVTARLQAYFYWTITFAAQRRLPGAGLILDIYRQPSLLWTIPAAIAGISILHTGSLRTRRWVRPTALFLLAAPFLWTILELALTTDPDDRSDQLLSLWPHLLLLGIALALSQLRPGTLQSSPSINTLLPLILLATIHGTFLSQQLWGSTYAIWPLLILLIASMLVQIPLLARPLAGIIAVTFILCGGLYAMSHERLSYSHLDASINRATLPGLRGLATPGPYIPAFEELVRFTNSEIPASDGILLLPGEDPFYFATGRIPRFPILLFDPATDPYTPAQTVTEARARKVRWLIVTRDLQLVESPKPDLPAVLQALQPDFILYRTLANYDIYRRR